MTTIYVIQSHISELLSDILRVCFVPFIATNSRAIHPFRIICPKLNTTPPTKEKYIDRPRAGSQSIFSTRTVKELLKMPFNELQRRDSWPPTILHLRSKHNPRTDTFESDIDENPFSYFLTSPDDISDFDDEDYSAGIESSNSKTPIIREVSPSSLQRVPLPPIDDEEEEDSLEMPLTLKDFTKRHTSPFTPPQKSPRTVKHHIPTGLGITIPESWSSSSRGRARVKLSPERGRGRGRARSLSARRPQSWRLPSPDIWSIEEENEDEGARVKTPEIPDITLSTPTNTHVYQLAPPEPAPKQRKKVHWAF